MSRPVVYRFPGWVRGTIAFGVMMFGGCAVLSYILQSQAKAADMSMAWGFAVAAVAYAGFAVHSLTVRYEVSGTGISRLGLLPRKTILWDQLKSVTIYQPDDIQLATTDGVTLSISAAYLANGGEIKALLYETSGAVPVREFHSTSQARSIVRRLPVVALASAAAAALLCYSGETVRVLGGVGVGVLFCGANYWIRNRQAAGAGTGSGAWWVLWLVIYIPLMLLTRRQDFSLLPFAACFVGLILGACLTLWPFRQTILADFEKQTHASPAKE